MGIWEADKLALFIAFVIPGFVSLKAYQLLFPGVETDSSALIVDAVAYSCFNYAILFLPIVLIEGSGARESSPVLYYLFYVVVLFCAPIGWAFLWRYLRTRECFQRNAPHPVAKPWDYFFSQRKPYWAKVTLKSGRVIAGRYAENSFASSTPAQEQIYLEEKWILDEEGAFLRQQNNTAGVLILRDDISHIEFRE